VTPQPPDIAHADRSVAGGVKPSAGAARQKRHYETIHDEYEAHYYDASSLAYRQQFILDPLLDGIDLSHTSVLDVAAGTGHNTRLLQARYPGLSAVGLDISDAACRGYTETTGFPAIQADLTSPVAFASRFHAAIVIGGLHHCVTNLPQTLDNLASALEPGGVLLMMEPNADCWLEGLRRIWYRRDRFFDAPTEHALSHASLLQMGTAHFTCERLRFIGGPAYYTILNSLVLRVPLGAKPLLAPPTFAMERAFNAMNSRSASAVFLARWRRKG
jgi:SAM-dependent methyltransferase